MELNDSQLSRLDSVGLAEAIRKGELSPTEAVQSSINRIEEMDGDLNAVVTKRCLLYTSDAADE